MEPTKIKDFPGRAVDAHLKATGRLPGEPPTIAIYYADGRWHAKCELIPELNVSSVTLFSLLNVMRYRADHVVESAVTTALVMREDLAK